MEVKKLREGTTLLLFLLLTRHLQIMPILVDGGANVCICWSFFFHFHFTRQNKKGKTTISCVKEEKSAAPRIHPYCLIYYSAWSKAAQSQILAHIFDWVSPAMTQWNTQTVSPAQPPSLWTAGNFKAQIQKCVVPTRETVTDFLLFWFISFFF